MPQFFPYFNPVVFKRGQLSAQALFINIFFLHLGFSYVWKIRIFEHFPCFSLDFIECLPDAKTPVDVESCEILVKHLFVKGSRCQCPDCNLKAMRWS